MESEAKDRSRLLEPIAREIEVLVDMAKRDAAIRQVILFGSFAYGSPRPDSDLDICIISADPRNELDLMRAYKEELAECIERPMDILVYTPEKFAWRSDSVSTIEKTIKNKGVTVYG
jgi:predicted nucleotidyltransferase